jgi:uncharacterized membrane protein
MASGDLKSVQTGLRLVLFGLVVSILTVAAAFLVPFLVGQGDFDTVLLLIRILLVMGVIGSILSITGKIFCLSTPKEMKGVEIIYIAVSFEVVSAILGIAQIVTVVSPLVRLGGGILSLAAFVLFLLYLRSLAEYVGDRASAANASSVLVLGIALVVCLVLSLLLALAQGGGLLVLVLVIAILVLGIIMLIRYVGLLIALGNSVAMGPRSARGDYSDQDDYGGERSRGRRRDDDDEEEDRPRKRSRDEDYEEDQPKKRRRDDDD